MYYDGKTTKKVNKAVKKDAKEYLTELDLNKDGALTIEVSLMPCAAFM